MSIRPNGYICYAFTCDHDGCTTESLMSSVDELSAALRLSDKGWVFELNTNCEATQTFCPLHSKKPCGVTPLKDRQL